MNHPTKLSTSCKLTILGVNVPAPAKVLVQVKDVQFTHLAEMLFKRSPKIFWSHPLFQTSPDFGGVSAIIN